MIKIDWFAFMRDYVILGFYLKRICVPALTMVNANGVVTAMTEAKSAWSISWKWNWWCSYLPLHRCFYRNALDKNPVYDDGGSCTYLMAFGQKHRVKGLV